MGRWGVLFCDKGGIAVSGSADYRYFLVPADGDAEALQPAVGDEVALPQRE